MRIKKHVYFLTFTGKCQKLHTLLQVEMWIIYFNGDYCWKSANPLSLYLELFLMLPISVNSPHFSLFFPFLFISPIHPYAHNFPLCPHFSLCSPLIYAPHLSLCSLLIYAPYFHTALLFSLCSLNLYVFLIISLYAPHFSLCCPLLFMLPTSLYAAHFSLCCPLLYVPHQFVCAMFVHPLI